jgi:hypothetical protein
LTEKFDQLLRDEEVRVLRPNGYISHIGVTPYIARQLEQDYPLSLFRADLRSLQLDPSDPHECIIRVAELAEAMDMQLDDLTHKLRDVPAILGHQSMNTIRVSGAAGGIG